RDPGDGTARNAARCAPAQLLARRPVVTASAAALSASPPPVARIAERKSLAAAARAHSDEEPVRGNRSAVGRLEFEWPLHENRAAGHDDHTPPVNVAHGSPPALP